MNKSVEEDRGQPMGEEHKTPVQFNCLNNRQSFSQLHSSETGSSLLGSHLHHKQTPTNFA